VELVQLFHLPILTLHILHLVMETAVVVLREVVILQLLLVLVVQVLLAL
jgi:hypothetical protein